MRFAWLTAAFVLAACTTASTLSDTGPAERCETTDCFNQQQIRNFEVIDDHTLIVYVGARECPFLVELTGPLCDVTLLPGFDIVFRPSRVRGFRTPSTSSGRGGADLSYARVCAGDLDMGLEEGIFSSAGSGRRRVFDESGGVLDDPLQPDRLDCRVGNVESLTDDEILEIYVDNRLTPPPPPFGTGEVTVEPDADAGAPEDDAAPPSGPVEPAAASPR